MEIPLKSLFKNTIIQGIFFLLLLWILWKIRFIVVIVFIAFIISSALYPVTVFLQERHIPKWLTFALPYIILVAIILVLIVPMIPFVVRQSTQFIAYFPTEIERAGKIIGITISLSDIQNFLRSRLESIGTNAVSFTFQTFNDIFVGFVTLFMSIYFLVDREKIHETLASFFSGQQTIPTIEKIEQQLGAWARGQIILSFSIALANFLGYLVIGIPYALPLAVFAGIMEIIPTVGPIIAAVPAVIVGVTISFPKALLALVIYILIQLIEGNFLVPRIMESAVGLHPIIVILAILIGSELLGIPGALISIPFVCLLTVIYKEILVRNR